MFLQVSPNEMKLVNMFFLAFIFHSSNAGTECSHYDSINDLSRSENIISDFHSPSITCDKDKFNGQWIRFTGIDGFMMPEQCPPRMSCHTHAPGWLNGAHPAVNDGIVDYRVCYHWVHYHGGNDDCCWQSSAISVRNCSGYYVYRPSPVPSCQLRLCTAHVVNKCDNGRHQCDPILADCVNTQGSYTCHCKRGYTGDANNCTDVNECENGEHHCRGLAVCVNYQRSYTCSCPQGFTENGGDCAEIDECNDGGHNCHEDAVCTNTVGSFTCQCRRGYRGNGTLCLACPEHSRCIQLSPNNGHCECWCKYAFIAQPEMDACKGVIPTHLPVVNILNAGLQPDRPTILRRDEARIFSASFTVDKNETGQISFDWTIRNMAFSPFNISSDVSLLVHNSLELNVRRRMFPLGLNMMLFEVRRKGEPLVARDFAFLQITRSALVAFIAGGNEVIRAFNKPINVDGSSSHDPEVNTGMHTGINFTWSCFYTGNSANNTSSNNTRSSNNTSSNNTNGSNNTSSNVSFLDILTNAALKPLIQMPSTVFMDHSRRNGEVKLDIAQLKLNFTYHILLTVAKDMRTATFIQTMYIRDERVLNIRIRCAVNCASRVCTSSRIALRTDCDSVHCPPSLTYRWEMHRKEGNHNHYTWNPQANLSDMLATKIFSRNLVIKQQMLTPGLSYRLTVHVRSPHDRKAQGWAAYKFDATLAPANATCHGKQMDAGARSIVLSISCQGWEEEMESLTYEFYRKMEDKTFSLLSYGVVPYSVVHIPPVFAGMTLNIKIVIVNVFGCASERYIDIQVVPISSQQIVGFGTEAVNENLALVKHHLLLGQINVAIQYADSALVIAQMPDSGVNISIHKQAIKLIISEMCKVGVENLERLFQITGILGKAAEEVTKLSLNLTVLVLNKLQDLTPLLSLTAKYHSDTRLVGVVARSFMNCISNIQRYAFVKASQETNITGNGTQDIVETKDAMMRIIGHSQNLTDFITNMLLSLKQPGEEYSVIRSKIQSTVLGKQSVYEMNNLKVHDADTSFHFPVLDDDVTARVFGNTSDVGVQMITYDFNPQTSHNSSTRVKSKVISLALKDDKGVALNVKNLPSDIVIDIPITHASGNTTPRSNHFFNPGLMQYHVIIVQNINTTVKFSVQSENLTSLTAFIRYGEKPTKSAFDDAVTLWSTNASSESDCKTSKECDHTAWITAKKQGKYYIGILGKSDEERVPSRAARSLLSESVVQEKCVKFKDPPPTPPPTGPTIIVSPTYEPKTSVNYSVELNTVWCAYWSDTEGTWTTEGCKVGRKSNSSSLECLCNHLTSFGGDILVPPNSIDFSQVQQAFLNMDPKDALVLAVVSSVFFIYFVVLVIVRRADNRDIAKDSPLIPVNESNTSEYKYEVSITTGDWRNSGTSANVSMILYGTENDSDVIDLTSCSIARKLFAQGNTDNFQVYLARPLGSLVKVQIGHDCSGKSASWFLNEILVVNSQTEEQWTFSCYRWLALERDDGNTTRVFSCNDDEDVQEFQTKFSVLRRNGFSDDHLWFSVVSKQPKSSFTRVQRASCCWCLLLLSMVTSAMFYETENVNLQTIQVGPFKLTVSQLLIAVESAFIALPPSIFIVLLFRKSAASSSDFLLGERYNHSTNQPKKQYMLPHWCNYIAWFICVGTAVTSAVFTVFYSLVWGGDKSARWLSSVVLSIAGDVIISQPTKIIILSVMVALRFNCGVKKTSARKQNADTCQTLFDLPPEEIKHYKKYKMNERKMYAFVKELIFMVLFFLLLMIVCYGDKSDHRYQMIAATEDGFQRFDKVTNTSKFWRWIREEFVSAIYTDDWYNGQDEPVTEYIGNRVSLLVGMPRLRQLRIRTNSCEVPGAFTNMIVSCHDFYSPKEEDTSGFDILLRSTPMDRSPYACPENWAYNIYTDERQDGSNSWGRFALYRAGGYVANLGYNKATAKRVIADLMEHDWIDRQTRAVLIEFSLFNAPSNLIVVAKYYYEVLPSGFTGTFKSYGVLPLTATDSQTHNVYLFFTLLFGVFLVCSFVVQCIRLFRQKCSYFKSLWNWLEILQVLSASTAILLQWIRSKETSRTFGELKKNPFIPISFHEALFWSEAENVMICITSVIATIRLLKCFYINRQVIISSSTIRRSFRSFASFFVIFFVISTGYAMLGILAFGANVWMFSSFSEAIITQFLLVLGSSIAVNDLEDVDRILGRLFIFSLSFTTVVITTNMFVAMLNDSYADSCVDTDEEDFEVADFIINRMLQTVFGYTKEEDGDFVNKHRFVKMDAPLQFYREDDCLGDIHSIESEDYPSDVRSSWPSSLEVTPVMYRSRQLSFANPEGTIVCEGKNVEMPYLWETCGTKDVLPNINTGYTSSDDSESMSSKSAESDGYTPSEDTCCDSLAYDDANLAPDRSSLASYHRDLFWSRQNEAALSDTSSNRSLLQFEKWHGKNANELSRSSVSLERLNVSTEMGTPTDFFDSCGYNDLNKDVWKELCHLLFDNLTEEFPDHTSESPTHFCNIAMNEDSE